ncbi:MAG: metallophosphoesterase [Deltaproteobacteria bacterium]|nr:metallophosphoesterase [Deltaproteobacteria bacterium]
MIFSLLIRHLDLLLFLFICAFVPVATFGAWTRRILKKKEHPRWRWFWTALFGCELLCILYAGFVEPRWLEVSQHQVSMPQMSQGLRLVHLSDLHLKGDAAWQKQVLDAVRQAKPDLIVLTGDYLNQLSDSEQLLAFCGELLVMVGPQRLFAVTGNFEWSLGSESVLHEAGVTTLDGTLVFVTWAGAALQVAGIGFDPSLRASERKLADLVEQLDSSLPAILLHHTPDLAESPGIGAFDLVLSGHTHGGQVRLPFYGALITMARHGKRYEAGWYDLSGGARMYVSRGVGMEAAPVPQIRFFCRPEVVVLDLLDRGNVR